MDLRTKGAISSFVQSGNFEKLTLMGFEPATLRVAVGYLTHYVQKVTIKRITTFQTKFLLDPTGDTATERM